MHEACVETVQEKQSTPHTVDKADGAECSQLLCWLVMGFTALFYFFFFSSEKIPKLYPTKCNLTFS